MKYLAILALGLSSLALIVAITRRPKLMSKEEAEKITDILFSALREAKLISPRASNLPPAPAVGQV